MNVLLEISRGLYKGDHFLYIFISTALCTALIVLSMIFAKGEKPRKIILKIVAGLLFIAILTNRLSQVFRYAEVRWYLLIPDSFCGTTSLVLSLAVLLGKRNNCVLHFVWLLGLFGGISTVVYPTFVDQGPTIFYLPTISGLVHHSLCATLVILLLVFKQIDITYKKWYYTLFGFTCYLTLGAFLMSVPQFNITDAFHINDPIISGTFLTAWGMAPIYAIAYGLILLIVELVRRKNKIKQNKI